MNIVCLLVFVCVDGFIDFSDAIPDAALPTPVADSQPVDVPIVRPVWKVEKEVQPDSDNRCSTCATGLCRAGRTDEADTRPTSKDGLNSAPARRFTPLRRLFRR